MNDFDALFIDGVVSDVCCCCGRLHGYAICSFIYQLDPTINGNNLEHQFY
jgi:hypothetical protein